MLTSEFKNSDMPI